MSVCGHQHHAMQDNMQLALGKGKSRSRGAQDRGGTHGSGFLQMCRPCPRPPYGGNVTDNSAVSNVMCLKSPRVSTINETSRLCGRLLAIEFCQDPRIPVLIPHIISYHHLPREILGSSSRQLPHSEGTARSSDIWIARSSGNHDCPRTP